MNMLFLKKWVVGVILAVFLVGCGSDNKDDPVDPTPSNEPTVQLTATPENCDYDGTVTLSWETTNVDSCTASGGWSEEKEVTGSQVMENVTSDATYTLTCTGNGKEVTDDATVTVGQAPAGTPTVSLSVDNSSVEIGASPTLTWESTNADRCTASGAWTGEKEANGNEAVGPLNTVGTLEYTITCQGNNAASQPASVSVVVTDPQTTDQPEVTLGASDLDAEDYTTLTWSTTNATSCSASADPAIDNWSGDKAVGEESERVGPITATTTFTLTCSGDGGETTQTATVDPPTTGDDPTVELSATGLDAESHTTLSWTTTNAEACTATADPATDIWTDGKDPEVQEERIGPVNVTTTFTLTCTGNNTEASASTTVEVAPVGDGTAVLQWTPPTTFEGEGGGTLVPADDLSGYKVYWGNTSGGPYSNEQQVPVRNGAEDETYTVTNLGPGTWYFVVTAIGTNGAESGPSEEADKTIE